MALTGFRVLQQGSLSQMKNNIWRSILIVSALFATILAVLDPSNYYFIRLGTGLHFTMNLTGIVLILVILVRKRIKPVTIELSRMDLALILFMGYLVARFALSPDYNSYPDKLVRYYSCFLFYCIYRIVAQKHPVNTASIAIHSVIVFGVMQSIYAVLQWFHIVPNLFNYRLGGTFGNPGDLANVLVIPYAFSLGLLLKSDQFKLRLLLFGSTLLLITVIGLSMARTAWIAVGIVSVMLIWKRHSELLKRIVNKVAIPVRITTGLVAVFVCIFVAVKLFQFKHDSAYGRIFIWERCVELLMEKPIFGHGYDSFITQYNKMQSAYFQAHPNDLKNGLIADDNFFAFNDFLQFGVEYGVVGLLLLLLVWFLALHRKNRSPQNNLLPDILNTAFCGLSICMCFSYPLQNLSILFIAFLLMAVSASLQSNRIFTIHLSLSKSRFLAFTVLFVFIIGIGSSATFIQHGFQWKKAYANYEQRNPVVIEQYKELLPILKYDRSFLYNYGTMLHAMGRYEQCLTHFEKYPNILWTSDLLLVVADCYDQTRNYTQAEACYREVSYLKPHLFVPKYKLFKLYQRTNEPVKAMYTAHQIQAMEIKVNSNIVMTIKNEINKFLLANTQ